MTADPLAEIADKFVTNGVVGGDNRIFVHFHMNKLSFIMTYVARHPQNSRKYKIQATTYETCKRYLPDHPLPSTHMGLYPERKRTYRVQARRGTHYLNKSMRCLIRT